jgi:putative transposase
MRPINYLNNIVLQDHRVVMRVVRPKLGFKSFHSALNTLQSIILMNLINKDQMVSDASEHLSASEQFQFFAA